MDEARALLRTLVSKYDRAASKGIVHRNTAARYKSRLASRLNKTPTK
jgi:small subunit ribosomal protein S20